MSRVLGIERAHLHNVIDNSLEPITTVSPGDTVEFHCPPLPLPRQATVADIDQIDLRRPHTMAGPVAVAGAKPGDTLVADIERIELAQDFGHCLVFPGSGLLPERFPNPYVQNFVFEDGHARLKPGVNIPLAPFCGIIGVAPAEPGEHSTVPPRAVGGNVDTPRVRPGSRVRLPVEVDQALFSCGDGHAAQGAGEVCGTAIETAIDVTVRFDIEHGRSVSYPEIELISAGAPSPTRPSYVTTAVGPDLYYCSQQAVDAMIEYLTEVRDLTPIEAYVLCSASVDLGIDEIVNRPNWVVSATLPLDIFTDASPGSSPQLRET